jgi:hypothetical protein
MKFPVHVGIHMEPSPHGVRSYYKERVFCDSNRMTEILLFIRTARLLLFGKTWLITSEREVKNRSQPRRTSTRSRMEAPYDNTAQTTVRDLSLPERPPLWSSGQRSWLQIQSSRVRFPALPDFLTSSCGPGTESTQPHQDN